MTGSGALARGPGGLVVLPSFVADSAAGARAAASAADDARQLLARLAPGGGADGQAAGALDRLRRAFVDELAELSTDAHRLAATAVTAADAYVQTERRVVARAAGP
jgi:hypothetical protein